jgi:hypothetical protein
MEVVVAEDDCKRTVAWILTMRPAMGLVSSPKSSFSSLAARHDDPGTSSEQLKSEKEKVEKKSNEQDSDTNHAPLLILTIAKTYKLL